MALSENPKDPKSGSKGRPSFSDAKLTRDTLPAKNEGPPGKAKAKCAEIDAQPTPKHPLQVRYEDQTMLQDERLLAMVDAS